MVHKPTTLQVTVVALRCPCLVASVRSSPIQTRKEESRTSQRSKIEPVGSPNPSTPSAAMWRWLSCTRSSICHLPVPQLQSWIISRSEATNSMCFFRPGPGKAAQCLELELNFDFTPSLNCFQLPPPVIRLLLGSPKDKRGPRFGCWDGYCLAVWTLWEGVAFFLSFFFPYEAFPTQHKIPIKHMFSPTGLQTQAW